MPLYLRLLHDAFTTELDAMLPVIGLLLAVGVVTSFIQAAFQIEDATFSLLPKTAVMILVAMFGGFGAVYLFEHFAVEFISHAPGLVRQDWG